MPDIFGKSGKGMELFDYFHIGISDIEKITENFYREEFK